MFGVRKEKMTYSEMQAIVDNISYKPGWTVILGKDERERPYVQLGVSAESEASLSPFSGEREPWKSGKHYLSPHMCRQEVVGAVFGAIQGAEMHELREWFRYKGSSIYNPHLDPDALVPFARRLKNMSFRDNAMSMDEDLGQP